MKPTKLFEEIELITLLSVLIPTAVLLTTPALWWECEPIKVFAGWMFGIVITAGVCIAISLYDEAQKAKAKERERNG